MQVVCVSAHLTFKSYKKRKNVFVFVYFLIKNEFKTRTEFQFYFNVHLTLWSGSRFLKNMEIQGIVEIATETKSKEISCQKKRNQFLNCLKSHFSLLKVFSVEHKKLLDRMFVLSTKLSIIERYVWKNCWQIELYCGVKVV